MIYISTHTYDDQTVRWLLPDPAMQFSNPYLGIGNNPVMYVDPDGRFIIEGITLATVIIKATSTAAVIAKVAATTAAVAGVTFAATQIAAPMLMNPISTVPPDGYLWDPSNPNQLQWQNYDGRTQGLDYITNTQTGETITRPMHTEFATKMQTGDLPGRFANLSPKMRITYPLDHMASLPAGPLNPSFGAPGLQTGVSALGPTPATGGGIKTGLTAFKAGQTAKTQLINLAGAGSQLPAWYKTLSTRVGQAGAFSNTAISLYQYNNNEISGAKFAYDASWSGLGLSPNPLAQWYYWNGVAGQHFGPSTWGWEMFGPDSYYGQLKYWIHKP